MIGVIVPEKTLKLNFRSMSKRQVEAMAAGTILAGGGKLAEPPRPPVASSSQSTFDLLDRLREEREQEAEEQRECDRRAQEDAMSGWSTNSNDILNRSDPPDFSFSSSSNYDGSYDSGGFSSSSGP